MTSLTQPGRPVRSVLRSTGVLGLSLGLTIAVVALLSSVVEGLA
jgi:hypothetical protein